MFLFLFNQIFYLYIFNGTFHKLRLCVIFWVVNLRNFLARWKLPNCTGQINSRALRKNEKKVLVSQSTINRRLEEFFNEKKGLKHLLWSKHLIKRKISFAVNSYFCNDFIFKLLNKSFIIVICLYSYSISCSSIEPQNTTLRLFKVT